MSSEEQYKKEIEELKKQLNEIKKQQSDRDKVVEKMKDELKKKDETINELKTKRRRTIFNPIALYSGGLKQYTDEEEQQFLQEEEKKELRDITEPRGDFINPKTGKKDVISLQPHQIKFITKFINSDARGSVVFHGTGTGKTLTAVVSSYAFLRYNPNSEVFVITPSATLQNFIFGMVQWGLDIRDKRYRFFTYDRYFRDKPPCDGSMLIIDEAHNFRTEIKEILKGYVDKETGEKLSRTSFTNVKGRTILENCAKVAKKVLLLTATPFVNEIYDIENLKAMAEGNDPKTKDTFLSIVSSNAMRKDYFRCLISKFELPVSADFPEKRESIVPIYMDKKFLDEYNKIEQSPNNRVTAFFNGVRRITNSYDSVNNIKIKWIIDKIKKGGKSVIFSVFLDTGVLLLKSKLNEAGINYAEITGKQNATMKEISKNRFNHFIPDSESYNKKIMALGLRDGRLYNVDVLLITKASAEGVDLIGTKNMILMDGAWNEATIQQIVARAVRYKSHSHLPKNERYVNIYRMILLKPTDETTMKKIENNEFPQWDFIMNEIKEKVRMAKELGALEKKIGKIEFRADTLKEATIIRQLAKQKSLSIADVRALPKNKRKEAWKQVEFDKMSVQKKEAEVLAGNLSKPSIDLFMLIKSKSKQLVINNFIDALSNVEQIENCISPIEEEYFTRVNEKQATTGREMTLKEKDALRLELFGSGLKSFSNKVEKEVQETNEELKQILQQSEEKRKKMLEKAIVNNLQEYFTPPFIADEMLKRIGVMNDKRDAVRVLEPTAGEGALMLPLIKRMAEGKQFLKIDMVEYALDNRKILETYKHGEMIELMNERNFLKFVPPSNYDYIVMNPPFHLRRKNFPTLYRRDIYDIDFVKRAFGMLKVGGRLIAITSTALINNNKEPFKSFNEWIKKKNAIVEETTKGWSGTVSQNRKKQELMRKLSLNKFAFIVMTKEPRDEAEDTQLVEIDYKNLMYGEPKLIDGQPAILMKDNKNQDPIKVEQPATEKPKRKAILKKRKKEKTEEQRIKEYNNMNIEELKEAIKEETNRDERDIMNNILADKIRFEYEFK